VPTGGKVTLTARVTGGRHGTVTFSEGGHRIGKAQVRNGRATLVVSRLDQGTHAYSATYKEAGRPMRATMGDVEVHVGNSTGG
jgi:hypothetical protein